MTLEAIARLRERDRATRRVTAWQAEHDPDRRLDVQAAATMIVSAAKMVQRDLDDDEIDRVLADVLARRTSCLP